MVPLPLSPQTPIEALPLVGKIYAQRLKNLRLFTLRDLLHHYPFRYQDFSLVSPISQLQAGETATVCGQIVNIQNVYTRTHKQIQKALIADKTGQIEVTWFNQPFLAKNLLPGTRVALSGKVETFLGKPTLISPEYEVLRASGTLHTGRLVPVYPETAGVSSKWLRSRIAFLLKQKSMWEKEWLPDLALKEHQLLNLPWAIAAAHFPKNKEEATQARHRLAFEELLELHLKSLDRKSQWESQSVSVVLRINDKKIQGFIAKLPFQLTHDQIAATKEILADLQQKKPMNRLMEGDVGSGKTVVAAIACYAAFLNGRKSAFMVPTSILADQHRQTLETLLAPYGVKIGFYTSAYHSKQNPKKIDLFLGTHALLFNQFHLQNLGLLIIDEQHRFGVEQRAKLLNQTKTPHLLTMTATPIPRTVALTLYGDLDLSLIRHLPKGRKPVKTWVVPKLKRLGAYRWIDEQIAKNHCQVFVVCPLIEESESERLAQVKAATVEFEKLKQVFPKRRLALLHGRLKAKEKQETMKKMAKGDLDILVTTPVVEVGIDIPQATIIMIEAAERFGLAQLHQLRGRVGRGGQQAYCLLFSELENAHNFRRLKTMEKYHSGAKLAQLDLRFRGPGEIYGTSQSGFFELKIASFADSQLIAQTRKLAQDIYNNRHLSPLLQEKVKKITIQDVKPN